MYYGYHRTSTAEQKLDRGILELKDYCLKNSITLKKIFTDKHTGKSFDRPDYLRMKKRLKSGDTLIITELDRLGRDRNKILEELRFFKNANVRIMILELPTTLIDISGLSDDLSALLFDTINSIMIELFASISEAEMKKRQKRQSDGIAAMKLRGEWEKYGRPMKVSKESFADCCRIYGNNRLVIMKTLGISSPTYYRYLERFHISSGK